MKTTIKKVVTTAVVAGTLSFGTVAANAAENSGWFMAETRKLVLLLLVLGGLWSLAYLWSFSILIWTEPAGDGFTRGLNRVAGFFGWQLGAAIIGFLICMFGRQLPNGGRRWLSRMPILLGFLPILFVLAVIGYAWMKDFSNPPQPYVPPTSAPTTEVPEAPVVPE